MLDEIALITGGAGFIGSHIVDRLISNGVKVRVLDNFSSGKKENLSNVINNENLEIIEGDIEDFITVKKAMKGITCIFHHAALVSVEKSVETPMLSFTNNVQGTFNVYEAARQVGVKRIVLASTAAVYGENQCLPLIENSHYQPLSLYAIDKVYAEQLAFTYNYQFAVETIVLRYFNVYGPRQDPKSAYSGVISIFSDKVLNNEEVVIYGDGAQTRDFIYIDDIVDANILAMETDSLNLATFNIGTGYGTSINELLEVIGNVVNRKIKIRFATKRKGDIYQSYASIEKGSKLLEWKAKVKLQQGISSLIL